MTISRAIDRALGLGFCLFVAGTAPAHAVYWNVFNIEGESALSAQIVTYAGLNDMLADTNRLGVFTPNPGGFGRNIVGSGSDVLPDDVPVVVPEPAGFASFGLGLAAMPFWLQRRRRGDAATRGDVARVPA